MLRYIHKLLIFSAGIIWFSFSQSPCPAQNLSIGIEDGSEFIDLHWDAPVENCDFGFFSLSVGGGSWDSEISWELEFEGAVIESGTAGSYEFELDYGDYIMHMYDSYGDGWNGASFTFADESGSTVASGTLNSGSYGNINFTLSPPVGVSRDLLGYNIHKSLGYSGTIIFTENTQYQDYEIVYYSEYCYFIVAVFQNGEAEPTEVLCGFVNDPAEYAVISMENGIIPSGSQNSFDIDLNNSYGIVGFQLELVDSPNYLSVVDVLTTSRTETFEIFSNEYGGSLFVAGYQPELLEMEPGTGPILEIIFSANEIEEDQIINMDFQNVILSDSNAQEVISYGTDCQITISTSLMPGDLNSDSVLNILDIVILINIILDVIEPTPYQVAVGDINADGEINVVDIVLLVNLILDD